MASDESDSVPHISDMDSPGSSVSSSLQREYEELLKYAVVTPKIQVVPSVYEQGIPVKDASVSETSGSSTSSSSASTKSSESTEESHSHAKEDVKQLPGTPSLKVSFQGQGSIARDSLLRSGKQISRGPFHMSPVDEAGSGSEISLPISFVKIAMCSYEKAGQPGYRDFGFYNRHKPKVMILYIPQYIGNDILCLSYIKLHGKELRYNKTLL